MEKIRYQGSALKYVVVYPDGYDSRKSYPLIILLHGFGSNMHDLAGLAPSIDPTGYIYLCPNGPVSVPLGPGMTGFAWTPLADAKTADDVALAEDSVSRFVDEVMQRHHTVPGRIILGGFSQGGMMTYQVGLPRPGLFAGLVALSGRVEDSDGIKKRLPLDRSQPVFIAHGIEDPLISIDQGRQSRDFLQALGYHPSYHEYPMAHQITQEVLDDLAPWIRGTLPPLS